MATFETYETRGQQQEWYVRSRLPEGWRLSGVREYDLAGLRFRVKVRVEDHNGNAISDEFYDDGLDELLVVNRSLDLIDQLMGLGL